VTWDVALDYKIRRDLAAYATIQRGYESGGYPARPYGGAATFIAYNPTYATNYEIGLKGGWAMSCAFPRRCSIPSTRTWPCNTARPRQTAI
jgi:hypothetical protein